MLPNVHLTEHFPANDGFTVTLLNWYKYQVDSTVSERVSRLRRKRRGEETLTTKATSTPSALHSETRFAARSEVAGNGNGIKREEIKSFEEAGENDLCGPPKNLWPKIKREVTHEKV